MTRGVRIAAASVALLVTVALTATATATAQLVDDDGPRNPHDVAFDLNGTWHLDRRSGVVDYLEATGAPWWQRAMSSWVGPVRQEIQQFGSHFEIVGTAGWRRGARSFVADGRVVEGGEPLTGDPGPWTARIEGDALVLSQGEAGSARSVRRSVRGRELRVTLHDEASGAVASLYFLRQKER